MLKTWIAVVAFVVLVIAGVVAAMILPPWLGHALNAPPLLIILSMIGAVGAVTGQLLAEHWLRSRLKC